MSLPARANPVESDAPGGLDVWLAPLAAVDDAARAGFRALLSHEETQRHDRFQATGARDEYLVGRALVRTTLSRYAPVAPQDWRFVANAHGRPAIAGAHSGSLTFNLSHTRGLVALAVAKVEPGGAVPDLGVDVETVERTSACRDLAGRYFAPDEAAFVRQASGRASRERFFAFWTLKEAYIKARGMGLALPLDGFAFGLSAADPAAEPAIAFMAHCPDEPGRWRFLRGAVSAEHRLALAVSPRTALPVRFLRHVPLTDHVEPLTLVPQALEEGCLAPAAPDANLS